MISISSNAEAAVSVCQAFVPGAGLGTRLKRLTQSRPKPLVPVGGRPLVERVFDRLLEAGVRRLIVNTHHLAETYARFYPHGEYRGAPLLFRHEPVLLETGGGIKNVEDLLEEGPLLIHNGDVFSTLPLAPAIAFHVAGGQEVTLVLRSGGGPLHIALEEDGAWEGFPTGRMRDIRGRLGRAPGTHLFTGIYFIDRSFLARLRAEPKSVVPTFLQMAQEGAPPATITIDEGQWWDVGTREQYLEAHRRLCESGAAPWVHPEASVAAGAVLSGATFVGPGSEIGPGARLHDSILWNGTRIAKDALLERCIVTDGQQVAGAHADADF